MGSFKTYRDLREVLQGVRFPDKELFIFHDPNDGAKETGDRKYCFINPEDAVYCWKMNPKDCSSSQAPDTFIEIDPAKYQLGCTNTDNFLYFQMNWRNKKVVHTYNGYLEGKADKTIEGLVYNVLARVDHLDKDQASVIREGCADYASKNPDAYKTYCEKLVLAKESCSRNGTVDSPKATK